MEAWGIEKKRKKNGKHVRRKERNRERKEGRNAPGSKHVRV